MTEEEAIAQWKLDNPMPISVSEDGVTREITPEEYEAMAADRGAMLMRQAERQAATEADHAEGQAILNRVKALETTADRLDSTEALTITQIRHFMAEHMRVTADSIRYIHKHSNLPVEEN